MYEENFICYKTQSPLACTSKKYFVCFRCMPENYTEDYGLGYELKEIITCSKIKQLSEKYLRLPMIFQFANRTAGKTRDVSLFKTSLVHYLNSQDH